MLSKQTIERIEQEAKDFCLQQGFNCPVDTSYQAMIKSQVKHSYIEAATAEATRHEQERKELVEALEGAVDYFDKAFSRPQNFSTYNQIKATLLKYKTQ